DYIVHLRPTTPLRDFCLIDKAIQEFQKDESFTSLRSAHLMSETAYKTFELEDGMFKSSFSGISNLDALNIGRQAFPITYSPNGYVDILKSKFILKNNLLHGDRVQAFITPKVTDIDSIEDFEFLIYQLNKDNSIFNKLFT
ncbi:MAG: acylneuraminate cytidylyltransferase family protein, partial [Parachlamydiaceae bacterium]|nr:acylneuraminate cytidylyltransferase family protein [Parachlamydiaceae bacterium]